MKTKPKASLNQPTTMIPTTHPLLRLYYLSRPYGAHLPTKADHNP